MAGLHFDITGDNSSLRARLQEVRADVDKLSKQIGQSGESIDDILGKLYRGSMGFLTSLGLGEFVSNVAQVRGEFQQLEIAFNTMLGSKEKANALMEQIVQTAARTPFDLQGVAMGAKQLLAYGTAAEEVNSKILMLGDIAAGVSAPLEDLVYLYGTTMTQGRMFTQDLRQFQGRGIPLAEELAKQFGVAKDEVGKLVTAGKVGAKEFNAAMESMATSRFKNLMEEQSKSITGQLSNLQDQIQGVFNDIGKSNEGAISSAISGLSFLVENYKVLGKTIVSLIAVYGAYRTALMVTSATHTALNGATLTGISALYANTTALAKATIAQMKMNLAVLANPYVATAVALTALASAVWLFASRASVADQAQEEFNATLEEMNKRTGEARSKAEELLRVIRDGNETNYARNRAYESLIALYPQLLNKIDLEKLKTMELTEAIKILNDARDEQEIKSKQDSVRSAQKALDAWDTAHSGEAVTSADLQERSLLAEKLRLATADLHKTQQAQTEAKLTNQDKLNRALERENAIKQRIAELSDRQSRAIEARNGAKGFVYDPSIGIVDDPENLQREIDALKKKQSEYAKEAEGYRSTITTESKRTADVVKRERDKLKEEWDNLSEAEKKSDQGNALAQQIAERDAELKRHELPTNNSDKARKLQDQNAELLKLQKDHDRERERALIDGEHELQSLIIDTITDGAERRYAKEELEHIMRMEAIKRRREDALRAEQDRQQAEFDRNPSNKGRIFDRSSVKLSNEQSAFFEGLEGIEIERYAQVLHKRVSDEKQAMSEYLREYGSYLEKRQAIKDLADARLEQATTEGEKLSIKAQMNKELSELDATANKTTDKIARIFGDMRKVTVGEMRAMADEAEQALAYITAGEFKMDDKGAGLFGITKERFDQLLKSPDALQAIKDEIANVRAEANQCDTALGQMAAGIKQAFAKGASTKDFQAGLSLIQQGVGKATQAVDFLSNSFSTLADATGSELFSGIAEGMTIASDAASSAMQGMQTGAMLGLGPVGAAAGAAIGAVTSLVSSLSKLRDKKHEARIQAIQNKIEQLNKSYEKLGKKISDAYSTSASKLIGEQEVLLKQKQKLLKAQIAEEKSKKKVDQDRIKKMQEEYDAISDTIEDNRRKAVDAIFGQDIKGAIEEFANAYADAWSKGNDRAEAARDFVRKQIRSMIMETIKETASKPMENLRKKLLDAYSDGVITTAEEQAIERMAVGIQETIDAKVKQGKKWLQDNSNISVSGSRGGFETMSQDTGRELSGRFASMQQDMRTLVLLFTSSASIFDDIRNISIISNGYLERISRNTSFLEPIYDRLGKIEQNTKSLR